MIVVIELKIKINIFLIINSFNGYDEIFKTLDISYTGLLSNEINGKILVSGIDYHTIFTFPNNNLKLKVEEIIEEKGERHSFMEGISLIKNNEEPDIIIENCEIIYYNKDKLIFKTK